MTPPANMTEMTPDDDPAALLDLAAGLAWQAGTLALAGRRGVRGLPASATKSSATDDVTEYDRAAERLVVDGLRLARPADAVVGEEGTSIAGTSRYAWYVDPIDGTTNFVYDLPSWCTSIAVTRDGVAVAGAVYLPVTDEMFTATHGGGAALDGRPIACSAQQDPHRTLVATGFGYDPALRVSQADRVARLIGQVRDLRRLGSAAIDLCHVACGRVDAYYEEHLNPWDVAAGLLIAQEAGAVASDFSGGPPRPEEIVVAAPGVHGPLVDLLAHRPI